MCEEADVYLLMMNMSKKDLAERVLEQREIINNMAEAFKRHEIMAASN